MATRNEHRQIPAERLLTADEVADLLQVTPAWVYAQSRSDRIPHVRLGRYVRYRLDAIERWVREIEAGVSPAVAGRLDAQRRRPRSRRGSPAA
jgi:excisionase family DNA binding protein